MVTRRFIARVLCAVALGVGTLAAAADRFTISPPPGAAFTGDFAVAPDGHQIAYIAMREGGPSMLWVQALEDQATPHALAGTEGASGEFWSPDSRSLGFFADGKLKTVLVAGATPRVLCDAPTARGGSWGSKGIILFAGQSRDGLYKISAEGGTPTLATHLDEAKQEDSHRAPQFLPDGEHFFFLVRTPVREMSGLYIGSLDSNAQTRVPATPPRITYAAGHLIYPRQGRLVAQRYNLESRAVEGDPFPISDQLPMGDMMPPPDFSSSDTGVLAYRSGAGQQATELTWFDRAGKHVGTLGPPGLYRGDIHIAPDGKRVAVGRLDPRGGLSDLFMLNVASGSISQMTENPANDGSPIWSPDGRRIVFTSTRGGMADLYVKTIASGEEKLLYESGTTKMPTSWSSDGRYIVFHTTGIKTSWDVWMYDTSGGTATAYAKTVIDEYQGYVSPDGKWIAYVAGDPTQQAQVFVDTFPTPTRRLQVSKDGGSSPGWRGDGRELFFLGRDRTLMAVPVMLGAKVEVGTPTPLFKVQLPIMAAYENGYAPSADGQRFLVNTLVDDKPPSPIVVVKNWPALAKKN